MGKPIGNQLGLHEHIKTSFLPLATELSVMMCDPNKQLVYGPLK